MDASILTDLASACLHCCFIFSWRSQFVHKGDILVVLDRERYSRALATAEANVAALKAQMDMREHEAARRANLTTIAISD
jgi:multidrug resistance efflux pump